MKRSPTKIRLSKADKAWSKLARQQAGFTCEHCGVVTEYVNAHHVEGRRSKSTRLILDNACVLCPNCHTFSSAFSAHKTPEKFKRWFKKAYPEKWRVIQQRKKLTMSERNAVEEFYRNHEGV